MIVGIDEVGRGCWAGPVCVGAVLLPSGADNTLEGLADSKVLTPRKREALAPRIAREATSVGIGWASAKYIDTYGIMAALKKAAAQAFGQINGKYDEVIVDGTINLLEGHEVTLLKKADSLIPAVSAASIVAKVARDHYMAQLDDRFAGYGFGKHVGYGTADHRKSLDALGPSSLHRMSFAPMASIVLPKQKSPLRSGAVAEAKAAQVLRQGGYQIIDRNWKTRWCEIDIIASKDNVFYFFEVKYRRTSLSGTGLDYITAAKLRRMKFAAQLYVSGQLKSRNVGTILGAVELQGPDYLVTNVIAPL